MSSSISLEGWEAAAVASSVASSVLLAIRPWDEAAMVLVMLAAAMATVRSLVRSITLIIMEVWGSIDDVDLATTVAGEFFISSLGCCCFRFALCAWILSQHYYICPPIKKETYRLPGPREPPCKRRPKRNMTALSYSCTTWKLQSHFKSKMNNKRSLTKTLPCTHKLKLLLF